MAAVSPELTSELTSDFSESAVSGIAYEGQKTKKRDAFSFSICFAIIAALTGAMLYARVAVTVSMFTSGLFYISLVGMVAFAARATLLARRTIIYQPEAPHLN